MSLYPSIRSAVVWSHAALFVPNDAEQANHRLRKKEPDNKLLVMRSRGKPSERTETKTSVVSRMIGGHYVMGKIALFSVSIAVSVVGFCPIQKVGIGENRI